MSCCLCSLILVCSVILGIGLPLACVIIRIFSSPYATVTRSKKEKQYLDIQSNTRHDFPNLADPYSVHLSVIIPAYNEENRLPPMLEECLEFLEERSRGKSDTDFKYEVIIVSDGATDKTPEVALKFSQQYGSDKVRLLQLETNRGKGGAVRLGVESARGALILFADADGATKFPDLSKLESAITQLVGKDYLRNPAAVADETVIVCGSRAHLEQQAIAERSKARNLLMHGFHFLVWLLAVRTLRDTQCGFKLFTRKAARDCFRSLHVNRWAFDVELLYIAEQLNVRLAEVSVRWTEVDGSKLVPVWSWLEMGKDLALIWLRYRIGAWKLLPA